MAQQGKIRPGQTLISRLEVAPNRRKSAPRAGKRVRDTSTPIVRSPTIQQANYRNIYVEDLAEIHRGSVIAALVSVSP